MKKRPYTLVQRAETREETRRRIVEATMRLHEELGPRATTISAIAEEAGVQRLTVYRHFPAETELFKACSSHWLSLNPLPDPSGWSEAAGLARVRRALSGLYFYYRGTERMWTVLYRDEADVTALREPLKGIRIYLRRIRDDLATHFGPVPKKAESRLRATLGSAVQFSTWQSLDRQGLDDAAMADLVCRWLQGAADRPARREAARRDRPRLARKSP
jgi:AcrR family transcriptional regulator